MYLLKFLLSFLCFVTVSCIDLHGLTSTLNLNSLLSGFFSNSQSHSQSQINASPTKNIMVTMPSVNDEILQNIESQSFPSRAARIEAMASQLKQASSLSQAPVVNVLKSLGVKIKTFWITNKIMVLDASPEVVQVLEQLQASGTMGIVNVIQEFTLPLQPTINAGSRPDPQGQPQWGVKKIEAPQVWQSDTRGEGTKVCVIDTGVNGQHVALRDNWSGLWYDPILGFTFPTDLQGHGSHCTGIICGQTGTGVAPGAEWMGCVSCSAAGCPESALYTCGEWSCMPGENGIADTAENAPDVVSCSWGGGSGQTFYNDIIKCWNTAGIVGVFAIGNSGPNCNTANSPGDQPGVISVGATNINNECSSFSSRGPTVSGAFAPLVSAPGEKINSCGHQSPTSYQIMSGTSMATPHVAGACALILSKNKKMKFETLKALMFGTCKQDLVTDVSSCEVNSRDSKSLYPNSVAGFGVVSLVSAMTSMKALNASNEI